MPVSPEAVASIRLDVATSDPHLEADQTALGSEVVLTSARNAEGGLAIVADVHELHNVPAISQDHWYHDDGALPHAAHSWATHTRAACDAIQFASSRNNAWVSTKYTRNVGVNLATIGIKRSSKCNRSGI